VTKQQAIQVSDKERTLIDRLRLPEYAGGVSEVAKPLWMSKNQIKLTRLLDYANRFHNGALTRRLGFLLELYDVAPSGELARLRTKLTTTYDRLDPTLPKSGPFLSRWRLQLNVDKSELEAIPHT
jgi:predicted transcriptional regulator of viral defense system